MKMIRRTLEVLALLFAIMSVLGALFWPAHSSFIYDDLLFPFAVIHIAIIFFSDKKWRWLILLFGMIFAWGLLTDFLANDSLRTSSSGMLLRWLKWPLIIVTIANCSLPQVNKERLINFVQLLFLGLVAINLVLLTNPFGLGETIQFIYAPKSEVVLGNYNEFGAFRLSGTMLNPNNNASIFGLFMLFFLQLNPKKYWKYCLMAFILVFLTQSRTILIVVLILLVIQILRMNSKRMNLVLIPSGIIGMFLLLFVFRSTNLISVFTGEMFGSRSWTERVHHFSLFFDSSFGSKIIGHGIILNPAKSIGFDLDSEYLSIAYQYGIIGALVWIAIILYLPMITKKITGSMSFGWMLVLFITISGITNFVFLNVEVITLISLIFGVWLFLHRANEIENHPNKEANQ
ncbi:MAG: hypothetical protein ACI837_001919 [Crocinitomicaceae bacterium]|jgi:hypothetical protein